MAIVIPEWLKGPDVAQEYTKGLQVGAQVAEESQRLQAENTRTQMEAQARAASLKQEQTMQKQRLETETAYKQAQIGLRKQQLDEVGKVNAAKTKAAAMKLQDQHGFASDVAGGMPIDQALFRHPSLATPQAAIAAHKDRLDLGQQRLDLSKQRLEQAQEQLETRKNKPVEIGEDETKTTDEDTGAVKTSRRKIFGTPGGGQPLTPPPAGEFKTPEDVKSAFKNHKIGKDQAKKILLEQFGYK